MEHDFTHVTLLRANIKFFSGFLDCSPSFLHTVDILFTSFLHLLYHPHNKFFCVSDRCQRLLRSSLEGISSPYQFDSIDQTDQYLLAVNKRIVLWVNKRVCWNELNISITSDRRAVLWILVRSVTRKRRLIKKIVIYVYATWLDTFRWNLQFIIFYCVCWS